MAKVDKIIDEKAEEKKKIAQIAQIVEKEVAAELEKQYVTKEVDDEMISQFMCENVDMIFYTNPFD
jgi:hypothetical protein